MSKLDILSYNLTQLEELILKMEESKFRAKQIFRWLHIDRVESFDEMKDAPIEKFKALGIPVAVAEELKKKLNEE